MLCLAIPSTLCLAIPAFGAESPAAGLQEGFERGTGALGALRRAGATLSGYASAERLGDGSWLIESIIKLDGNDLRLPVKLNPDFDVSWTPTVEYGDALVGISRSGALPKVDGAHWGSRARLPAFPVIVTGKRVITVFGVVPFAPSVRVEPDETLMKHTQRWIHETLVNDPAPASFDILAAGDLAWIDVLRVIYSISATGLFEMNFIGHSATNFAAVPGLSPIILNQLSEVTGVVSLGVASLRDDLGFRVAISGILQPATAATCDPSQTFCASTRQEFEEGLADVPGVADARLVIAPEFGVPFQRVVEVTGWATLTPILSIVAP